MSERVVAPDEAAFERLATRFAEGLRGGDVVGLVGGLGAGKTTFVRAVARARFGTDDAVSSPTFVFRQRYDPPAGRGGPAIEHLDLYRIERADEARELGLEEALESGAIVFVEWPERLAGFLPPSASLVRITGAGDAPRTIEFGRADGAS